MLNQNIKGSVFDPFDTNISQTEKIKFLVSDTYCKLLTDFAKGITGDMQARVVILPSFSNSIAYTDGHTYFVCTTHSMFINEPIQTITEFVLAIAFHEHCHGMYTNFKYWTARIKQMKDNQKLYKWLFNAICDARIERIGSIKFPGIKHFLYDFRQYFYEHDNDEGNKELEDSSKLLNNILLFATCGKTKCKLTEELEKVFEQCRPSIIAGRRSDSTADCDSHVNRIFNLILPYITKDMQMPPQPTSMSASPSNGEDFENDANTGGADTITFDEDTTPDTSNDTSKSDDTTDKTNSKTSDKSSKKSDKSSKNTNDKSDKKDKKDDDSSKSSSGNSDESSSDEKNANGSDDNSHKDTSDTSANDSSNEEDGQNSSTNSNQSNDNDANANINSDANTDGTDDTDDSANSDTKSGGDSEGKKEGNSVRDLEAEATKSLLENALKNSIPAYEKENKVKAIDEGRMNNLSQNSSFSYEISCAKLNPADSPLYAEMVQKTLPIIKQLTREMKKVINWNQDEICHKQGKGYLDTKSLPYMHQGTCFGRKIEKSDEADLFISMLLDCSGSMSGQRMMNTAITATIILEACCALNIPVSIKGFTSGKKHCEITHFWDHEYKNRNMRQNIVQIFASGSTPLTEALQYERKFLSSVKKQDKICFVVTDGAPNHVDSATDEFKRLSKNALAYGVAIGDDIPRLQSVFGENSFIDARDIKKLPYYICNIIKKNMLK